MILIALVPLLAGLIHENGGEDVDALAPLKAVAQAFERSLDAWGTPVTLSILDGNLNVGRWEKSKIEFYRPLLVDPVFCFG